jgi:hypothetical protein
MVQGNHLRSVRPTTMDAWREGGKRSSKPRTIPTLHVYTLERNLNWKGIRKYTFISKKKLKLF